MDAAPPSKRRRTSSERSDYSSRPGSRQSDRDRNRDRSRRPYSNSRSRSRDHRRRSRSQSYHNNDSPLRRPSYAHRSPSDEYTPHRRSYSRESASRSPDRAGRPRLSYEPLFNLPNAHARGITSAKFSPDFSLLATASADACINIYVVPDTLTPNVPFKLLRTLRSHKAGVNAISWSPVGPPYTLASASDDKSILLWNPLSSDFPIPPSPLTGHSNYVYSLAFSPKGNMLVSGSYDEAVFLWDVRSARVMRQLPAHSDPVSGVDFVRDGTMVCSCASDGLIRIWDSGTGQCLKTVVDEDRKAVTAVRFSPNGRFVLAWTLDNCIRLWRYLGDAACVKTYQGHVNSRYSLAGVIGEYTATDPHTGLDRTDAFVASGSEDGDLLVWDVNTKDILWRGVGHSDVVLAVDFMRARDGRGLLASVGKGRELRVWVEEVEPGRTAAAAAGMGVGVGMGGTSDAGPGIGRDAVVRDGIDADGHVVKMEIKREDSEMEDV